MILDFDFKLRDESGEEFADAFKIFSDNISDGIIQHRRSIGIKDGVDLAAMADVWEAARDEIAQTREVELDQQGHDYLKMFLAGDPIDPAGVITWVGTLKQQFLTAFQQEEKP